MYQYLTEIIGNLYVQEFIGIVGYWDCNINIHKSFVNKQFTEIMVGVPPSTVMNIKIVVKLKNSENFVF